MSGCAGPTVCGVGTSTAAILVLYILLVIILKSCWV
ncbi:MULTISPECIES: YjcZ family sporulation protein [Paenibacillus]|nr:YjcZ family sporulation protein [Paenibacillus polymyxa]WCM59285.1 YjcZ family sporulation protein [Paenibacillus polymyxa]